MKKKRRFRSISLKMIALCQIPMIVIGVLVIWLGTNALQTSIDGEIEKSLKIVATSVGETYTNLYKGDYSQNKHGTLMKGETQISGESQLIDGLKENTGFDVSFMYGKMRLLTTLRKDNGARVNGTSISDAYYSEIQAGKPLFLRDYDISGKKYYVYYQPLINSDGSVVGAIETAMDSTSVKEVMRNQMTEMTVISLVVVAIAAVLVTILSRRMVVTMRKIKVFLDKIASGELDAVPDTKVLKKNDELGDIYRMSVQLQESLYEIVTDIKETTNNLTSAANKLTQMAEGTQISVTDVYQSVDEISGGAKIQATESARASENVVLIGEQIDYVIAEVDSLTVYARQMSVAEKESEDIILELDSTNEVAKGSVAKVANQIADMNLSIQNITQAVDMIQAIAEETDLLSLNASIEAARAGEAGRGFAVVADQICRLADQSQKSAIQIEKIIAEVVGSSDSVVNIMEEVQLNMNDQQTKLQETRVKYKAVAEGVEYSLNNIDKIKNKLDVLNESKMAIHDVVEGLAAISEQNVTSAERTTQAAHGMRDTMNEMKDSSENLLNLSDRLEEVLQKFKM